MERGETDRRADVTGLKRARSRGPGGPRDAHVGPTCSLRERRMREVYTIHGRSTAAGARSMRDPLPTAGE